MKAGFLAFLSKSTHMEVFRLKNVSISVFAFNVQNNLNEMVDLKKVAGKGIKNIFTEYMKDIQDKYESIPSKEKVYKSEYHIVEEKTDDDEREKYTFMFGKIKTGSYGIASEIVDSETGELIHTKTDKEADVLPFYFCMAIPASGKDEEYKGLLIFQTIGINSMRSTFETSFNRRIKEIDKNLKFVVGHLAPISYIQNYMDNGILENIILTKYKKYEDPADRAENGFDWEKQELNINKPRNFLLKKKDAILNYLKGGTGFSEIVEINDFGFKYDVLKFDFKLGSRTKRINLSNLEKVAITEDVTKRVKMEGDYPSQESMKTVMEETVEEYMSEIGAI